MKNLVTKMVRIMASVKRVAKNGRNDFHKYDYVTESDIMEAVREHLVKENVFIFSSVMNSHKDADITSVVVKHTFVDGDSGETFEVTSLGQGQDKGDKGANKAVTAAMKYFLMKNLLMPTGDDAEATDETGKATSNKVKILASANSGVVEEEGKGRKYGFSGRAKPAPAAVEVAGSGDL